MPQPRRQRKHTGQRQCLSLGGSGNQGKGVALATEAAEHKANAVSQPRRQWHHTRRCPYPLCPSLLFLRRLPALRLKKGAVLEHKKAACLSRRTDLRQQRGLRLGGCARQVAATAGWRADADAGRRRCLSRKGVGNTGQKALSLPTKAVATQGKIAVLPAIEAAGRRRAEELRISPAVEHRTPNVCCVALRCVALR